jgi:tRNA-Thr(GGU) m(6)t(6)A37 methyltransferase TsaA
MTRCYDAAMEIRYRPVGTIHSPFAEPAGAPIQPVAANTAEGSVEVLPELEAALQDLAGFSHIILLYHFDRACSFAPLVTPFLDRAPHGVFATRVPSRPNAIGLSVVELLEVRGTTLRVRGIDVLDGTPLLDVKPYVAEFDARSPSRSGWLEHNAARAGVMRDDGRFWRK